MIAFKVGILTWHCDRCGHRHLRRTGRCSRDYLAPENQSVACRCPRRRRG